MGIPSDGSYGIPEELMFSFPVTCHNGEYSIVQGLTIGAASQAYIDKTRQELEEERAAIAHLV
jgi:malate dehydrogenase